MKKKIAIISILTIIVLLFASFSVFADIEADLEDTTTTQDNLLIAPLEDESHIPGTNEVQKLVVSSLITARTENNSDVYQAGETLNIKGENVKGNVYLAGKDIVIEDEIIYGDLFVAGQRIEIKDTARINGNVFAAGQDLFINGIVDRAIYVAGSTIEIGKTSSVGYSAYVAGAKVIVKGTVTRNLNVGTNELKVESTASIIGDLNYSADQEGDISKDAKIGNVNFSKVEIKEKTTFEIVEGYVFDFLGYFVCVMLILIFVICFAPKFADRAMEKVTFGSFGLGLLWFIIIPAIAICLIMTRIPALLGFVTLLLYIVGILLSGAVACIAIGKQIEEAHEKIKLPLATALVAVISWIVFQIPYIGSLASAIMHLLGFGILLRAAIAKREKTAKEVTEVKE